MESIDENILDDKIKDLALKKETLQQQLNSFKEVKLPVDEILSLKDFDWETEPLENKLHMIDTLIHRIIVGKDGVDVYFNF